MTGLGEFELIERCFSRASTDSSIELGIGDDAAIVRSDGSLVIAVDTLVGGVHFPPELAPGAVGHRALAVNLSDLAAMGSRPRWATLALTLPTADSAWIEAFAAGFFELATRFGVSLIGGDTTRGPLTITVQLLGTLASDRALLRSGGRIGDDIYVTGTLGDAAGGLRAFAKPADQQSMEDRALMERFAYPEPRVAAGLALVGIASAAIDISDGLIADLGHLCQLSHCGANVELETLPLSSALVSSCSLAAARDFALTGGDDYELCFTAAPAAADAIATALEAVGTTATRIGELTADRVITCRIEGNAVSVAGSGYSHF